MLQHTWSNFSTHSWDLESCQRWMRHLKTKSNENNWWLKTTWSLSNVLEQLCFGRKLRHSKRELSTSAKTARPDKSRSSVCPQQKNHKFSNSRSEQTKFKNKQLVESEFIHYFSKIVCKIISRHAHHHELTGQQKTNRDELEKSSWMVKLDTRSLRKSLVFIRLHATCDCFGYNQ